MDIGQNIGQNDKITAKYRNGSTGAHGTNQETRE